MRGEVIVVLHEHAILGKGQTMHSSGQMEHHRNLVHDKSMKVGGLQCIITVDECVIPLQITNGLPHMKMRPHADEEWERLPNAFFLAQFLQNSGLHLSIFLGGPAIFCLLQQRLELSEAIFMPSSMLFLPGSWVGPLGFEGLVSCS